MQYKMRCKNSNKALTTVSEANTTLVSDGTGPIITKISANDGANTKVVVEFDEALGTHNRCEQV